MNYHADLFTAFLPCRRGSKRVPKKNTRPFGGDDHGLVAIKLRQLIASTQIDQILVSTDDPLIFDLCNSSEFRTESRLVMDERPPELAQCSTSTDALIDYVAKLIPQGHILWTHVTSPFLDATSYEAIIQAYWTGLSDGYDSLMTVSPFQNFLWTEKGPINYDGQKEKWPRTQTLEPLFIVNSGAFIAPASIYHKNLNRVGNNPYLYELDHFQELDIDRYPDFQFCDAIWRLKSKEKRMIDPARPDEKIIAFRP